MIDFTGVKAITIPEGSVKKITANGVTLWEKISFVNLLPLAIGSDGKPYNNGQGWKANTRLNSSGVESTSSATGIEVTGFIPVKHGDKVYLSGITMNNGTKANLTYAWLYDANFNKLNGRYRLFSQFSDGAMDYSVDVGALEMDSNRNVTMFAILGESSYYNVFYTGSSLADMNNVAYLRISCEEINNNSIITVNQPIE